MCWKMDHLYFCHSLNLSRWACVCVCSSAMFPYWRHPRPQHQAATHGTPQNEGKIILIIIKKHFNTALRSANNNKAARNYHISCDPISVEINCHFNLVFSHWQILTSLRDVSSETSLFGPQIRHIMCNCAWAPACFPSRREILAAEPPQSTLTDIRALIWLPLSFT